VGCHAENKTEKRPYFPIVDCREALPLISGVGPSCSAREELSLLLIPPISMIPSSTPMYKWKIPSG
jgi:hypothetical protein